MKKYIIFSATFLISFSVELASMAPALAATASTSKTYQPMIISEMQPGSSVSASQEFIELYNQSDKTINLAEEGWQLQITTSTAANWSRAKSIKLTGSIYPGRYYLAASSFMATGETKSYLQDYASVQFSAGLTSSSGHIRLVNAATLASENTTEDSLEWSTLDSSGKPNSPAIEQSGSFMLSEIMPAGMSIKRKINSSGQFVTTGTANQQFVLSNCPSPTANSGEAQDNQVTAPMATSIDASNQACISEEETSTDSSISEPKSEPPAVLLPSDSAFDANAKIPESDSGLESPRITELLPNPASPKTDATDEFIELYNGNSAPFDLSGFRLKISGASQQSYTFPNGTVIAAGSFQAFYSKETSLHLSNGSGGVALYDPLGKKLAETNAYSSAKDGFAWVYYSGAWYWSDTPTPGLQNIIHLKETTKKTGASKSTQAQHAPLVKLASTRKKTVKPKAAKQVVSRKKKPQSSVPMQNTAEVAKVPVHTRIIALVASCALLYGAYEYRRDLANRFYQFRSNREARRKARQRN